MLPEIIFQADHVATQAADLPAVPLRRRSQRRVRPESELRTITARLTLTEASLQRLLTVSGSHHEWTLSAANGATTVRAEIEVSSVPSAVIQVGGGVELNWATMTISSGFNRVTLTRSELRLLIVLLEAAPATVDYTTLLRRFAISERRQPGEGALAVVVCALRKRLAAVGRPDAIRTERGSGYSLRLS